MNRLLSLIVLLTVFLEACSKKNNVAPARLITINSTEYPTVVFGNQTWTSVNYNGPGGINYNNQTNDPVYGKLYSYTEANNIVLPKGWRLPTKSDFEKLLISMGATLQAGGVYILPDTSAVKLLSKTSWPELSGTNSSGFNAVAAGYGIGGGFADFGKRTNMLSSSQFGTGQYFSLELEETQPTSMYIGLNGDVIPDESDRGSVRFVKDN